MGYPYNKTQYARTKDLSNGSTLCIDIEDDPDTYCHVVLLKNDNQGQGWRLLAGRTNECIVTEENIKNRGGLIDFMRAILELFNRVLLELFSPGNDIKDEVGNWLQKWEFEMNDNIPRIIEKSK